MTVIGASDASTDEDSDAPDKVADACDRALAWAAERDYTGWDPYDGLESPFVPAAALPWPARLVVIQGVNRAPVNLRPLLGVPRERNPKGVALFAMAHLERYETIGVECHLDRAERLLAWLIEEAGDRSFPAWGYNFAWQNGRKFFLPADQPNIVVSVFCARAFLHHHRVTGNDDSLSTAAGTCEFVRERINTETVDGHEVFAYTPRDSFVIVNTNALAASLFADVASRTDDPELADRATELVTFVRGVQAEDGAWYYAVPPDESHLSHDNFHTGFVLESLRRYLRVRSDADRARAAYDLGMNFYRRNLFDADGAPRFEHDSPYPRDAHAAGQAIRTFVVDGRRRHREQARRVAEWSVEHLFDERGYFYRRKGRLIDDTTPYMRWSQAWLCYGIASSLRAAAERESGGAKQDGTGQ